MRYLLSSFLLAPLVAVVDAFPAAILEAATNDPSLLARAGQISESLARPWDAETASPCLMAF